MTDGVQTRPRPGRGMALFMRTKTEWHNAGAHVLPPAGFLFPPARPTPPAAAESPETTDQ